MISKKAVNKIEALCEQGCSKVSQLLTKANSGEEIEELANFDGDEITHIIGELGEIMSIYQDKADNRPQ